jgi:hypothetical protein
VTRRPRQFRRTHISLPDSITEFANFRRLIHSDQNLHAGVGRYRRRIENSSVTSIALEMLKNSIYRNSIVSNPFPRSFDKIKGRASFPGASQEIEILWTACILASFQHDLNAYIALRNKYARRFMIGDYEDALKSLDQIEDRFGYSLWSICCRFAVLQKYKGTAEQKLFLSSIISTSSIDAVVAYLSFLFSYSVEDNVTLKDIRQ